MKRTSLACLSLVLLSFTLLLSPARAEAPAKPLSMVVMDPLAAPLSCPCVEGYAQRKYEVLAEYLEQKIGRSIKLTYAESLVKAAESGPEGGPDLIIGKDSVVRHDAQSAKLKIAVAAMLTGKDGVTTQTGLFVVPSGDPAKSIADLGGYRILFGPKECDEKYAAAIASLRKAKVAVPAKIECSQACSDGACLILELGADVRAAAVISSYAKPLLEGCGTVEKGALRVVGETAPVPFITAFVNQALPEPDRQQITQALLTSGLDAELCQAMETVLGFVDPAAVPDTK